MSIRYNRLWKLLIDRKMTKTELREKANFSTVTLAKMGKNQNVSTEVLAKICTVLNCGLEDIAEFYNEEQTDSNMSGV